MVGVVVVVVPLTVLFYTSPQGLWEKDHSLLQLPHFSENEVKHASRGMKGVSRQLADYLRLADEEKKGQRPLPSYTTHVPRHACLTVTVTVTGLNELSEEERDDVLVACRDIFPR